ncbi:hypothetical protein AgCh_034076 [Apium graveolens]
MLRACVLDFSSSWSKYLPLIEFPYNNSFQASIDAAPYKILYGRKCRSPIHWDEKGEGNYLGPELVRDTTEVVKRIKERMLATQSRQKSYADPKQRDVEFSVRDKVFLKIAPVTGIIRFGKKGKLSPRFVGPFEILEKVGKVDYKLTVPPSLEKVHNVFHVSLLRKYMAEPSHVFNYEPLKLSQDLTYMEKPVQNLDRKEKELRNKKISLVSIFSRNSKIEERKMELGGQVLPIEDLYIRENDEKRGKPIEDLVSIPLAPEDPEKVTFVGATLEEPLRGKLVKFLQENSDVFAWSVTDMPGIDPELITHKLNVDLNRKTVKQKKRSFTPEGKEAIKKK